MPTPNDVNGRARLQGAIEMAAVPIAEAIERAIDHAAESVIDMFRAQQMRRHHRRKNESDDAGNENCAGERERELAKERTGQSTLQRDRCVNRGERDRHRDDRPDQFARADQRGVHARQSFAHMALDVFDHDDGVVDDQPDRKHDREQREQVEREAEELHQEERADERNRNRDDRHDDRAERAEEQEDHDHHDEQRVDQSFYDFVDGVVDVGGGVVGHLGRHAGRQFLLDLLQLGAHALDDVDRVRIGQDPDAHEDRFLPGEADFGVVIFRAENDVGDVAQPNECAFVLAHDELLELISGMQIGVRGQVHLKERTLGAADGGEIIVSRKRTRGHRAGLMFSAAMRSGFIQMRMAKVRPPRMSAFCTPPTAVSRGWTSRTR